MTILQKILYLIFVVLILCIPAFYNGFPLLFPDTVGYVSTGFRGVVGAARLWLYGGFLRHVSLCETVWLVIFVQGLIISGVVYLMFKYFMKSKYSYHLFIIYLLIVGTTTAISFHVSMLMPDIFTPVVILSFALLLLAKNMSTRDRLITICLFLTAVGMHNSHIVLSVGLLLSVAAIYSLKKWRLSCNNLGVNLKKIGLIGALIFCSHIGVCTLHYSLGGDFSTTRGSRIFLFARLCDFGIAQSYLQENCPSSQDSICNDLSILGTSPTFLWGNKSQSYLNKTGGFSKENEIYYKKLTTDILTRPKYLKKYIIKSMEAMFMQFFTFQIRTKGDSYGIQSAWISIYYNTYNLASKNSRQMKKKDSSTAIERANAIQFFVLGIAGLFFLILLWDDKILQSQKGIALFILVALFINAFIVGATSGVYDRYQSRVAWLITLPAFWYIWSKVETFIPIKNLRKDSSKID